MARGAEVVRQWTILQSIDAARHGTTVADLAKLTRVAKRTIWRDLAALQEAGFPLYDEKDHGTTRWRLNREGFKGLVERGLSLTQLCALYFSRTLVEVLTGTPFHDDLRGVFEQFRELTVLEESYEGPKEMDAAVFPHSLGAHTGEPQRIELEFAARVSPYVKERRWHPSQKIRTLPDGSLRMSLRVCDDWSLRSWILGFGPFARVVSPSALAEEILEALEEARTLYAPRMELEIPTAMFDDQPALPFRLPG